MPISPHARVLATAAALAAALSLGACSTSSTNSGDELPDSSPTATPSDTEPIPLANMDLSGLAELDYTHNEQVESDNLVQWQTPGCIVQAVVAPHEGSGDDAADSVAAFDSFGPEFTDLTERDFVHLPLVTGGTLIMAARSGTVTVDDVVAEIDLAARAVGEVDTLFVITHSCSDDAPSPTSLDDVMAAITLRGVVNPDV
ncbi:MAG TPA: hypothetical protein VFC82_07635 [Actinomycetaceae bacterium]|nr:hypothetical protein [Actinomycetaceae bacterium]